MECVKVNGVPVYNNDNTNNNNNTCTCNGTGNGTCTCTCTCTCNCVCNGGWNNTQYGNLTLYQHGGYIARFYISWDEPTVVDNSIQMIKKQWENNGHQYPVGFSTTISIPMTAQNVSIKAEGNTGLVWQLWNTIINKVGLPMVPSRTVTIWGTTLSQHGSVVPDTGGTSGYLYLDHYGAYIARFIIAWDEEIDLGNNVHGTVRKEWEDNLKNFSAPYHGIIPMSMTAYNIFIRAQSLFAPGTGQWLDIVFRDDLGMVSVRTVTLTGTSLLPKGTIDPD